MKEKSKKLITIKPIRKATEAELKSVVKWTIGISKLPGMDEKARAYFPTHSFEILKNHRESVYKDFIVPEFSRERAIKVLKITEDDFKYLRRSWLNNELKEIDRMSNIPGITMNEIVQIERYRDYINAELNKSTNKKTKELSDSELGLLAFYNGEVIARSARSIYNKYIDYCSKEKRLYNFTEIKAENQIKRIEKILTIIKESKQQRAIDEIKIIRVNLEKGLYRK